MDENKKELQEVMLDIKPSKVETPVLLGELDIVMNVVKRQKKQDGNRSLNRRKSPFK